MAFRFTMLNDGKVVPCQISGAALVRLRRHDAANRWR